jgi:phosphohistidine phosphatase SixA
MRNETSLNVRRFLIAHIGLATLVLVLIGSVVSDQRTLSAQGMMTAVATPAGTMQLGMLQGEALVAALRQGGYIIFFRHAATDRSQSDTDTKNLENCKTQRNLSDKGRTDSRAIGEAFRRLNIPVGDILTSGYCRAREMAQLAFERGESSADLILPSTEEQERLGLALRRLLVTPPKTGTNTVLISHQPNIQFGADVVPQEGEAIIFQPGKKVGYIQIGSIKVEDWTGLMSLAGTATATQAVK